MCLGVGTPQDYGESICLETAPYEERRDQGTGDQERDSGETHAATHAATHAVPWLFCPLGSYHLISGILFTLLGIGK